MVKHFCEACAKYFKDKNGMNCHMKSEKHRMQDAEFQRNKPKYKAQKSLKFEKEFLQILRVRHPNKKMRLKDFMLSFCSTIYI